MSDSLKPPTTSRFVRACLRQPVDRTPVWFLRQAGRYMPEYMAVRKHHSLIDICTNPDLAAEVTITAAERLGVDAAIIFADLLLPFTPMGVDFEFVNGEGPVIHQPIRTAEQVLRLRTDRANDLRYVATAIEKVVAHFKTTPRADSAGGPDNQDQLGIIGFCGAPFTLASYMIEGGSSRNYAHTKQMMYTDPAAWRMLMEKLSIVLFAFAAQQVEAGADVIQVFDSWAGALSPADYRDYVLPATTELIQLIRTLGVPVIYFGVDTMGLLPDMRQTGADVIGLDWRTPLAEGWKAVGHSTAIQGNLDPITLFAPEEVLHARVKEVLDAATGRPGHIFNLGHGIVPNTPVDAVINVVKQIKASR